ncbi:hypothetical protein WA158_008241 [Blastocystis sp. Blastoise]
MKRSLGDLSEPHHFSDNDIKLCFRNHKLDTISRELINSISNSRLSQFIRSPNGCCSNEPIYIDRSYESFQLVKNFLYYGYYNTNYINGPLIVDLVKELDYYNIPVSYQMREQCSQLCCDCISNYLKETRDSIHCIQMISEISYEKCQEQWTSFSFHSLTTKSLCYSMIGPLNNDKASKMHSLFSPCDFLHVEVLEIYTTIPLSLLNPTSPSFSSSTSTGILLNHYESSISISLFSNLLQLFKHIKLIKFIYEYKEGIKTIVESISVTLKSTPQSGIQLVSPLTTNNNNIDENDIINVK